MQHFQTELHQKSCIFDNILLYLLTLKKASREEKSTNGAQKLLHFRYINKIKNCIYTLQVSTATQHFLIRIFLDEQKNQISEGKSKPCTAAKWNSKLFEQNKALVLPHFERFVETNRNK